MNLHKFKIVGVFVLIFALTVTLGACDRDDGGTGDTPSDKYTLTINHEGGGTTTPSEGEHQKDEDNVVNISVEPDEGWEFEEWAWFCSGRSGR